LFVIAYCLLFNIFNKTNRLYALLSTYVGDWVLRLVAVLKLFVDMAW